MMEEMLQRDQESEDHDACPYGHCDGSGEYPEDVRDPESGEWMVGVGIKKCLCKSSEISED